MKALLCHGGAGRAPIGPTGERQSVLDLAAAEGLTGRNAVEMVERAVRVLEDHPIFDSGTGAFLTLDGECELDACLMTPDAVGAVASLTRTQHPISVARAVMERTDHAMLVGEGARKFARLTGHPDYDPVTPERRAHWEKLHRDLKAGRDLPDFRFWKKMSRWLKEYGRYETCGAVAIDAKGRLAAATSTGGIWMKLPGRVGDSPIPGAGTCCTENGAVSATGHGEGIMRLCLGRVACDFMKRLPCPEALEKAIELASEHDIECALIGVDRRGRTGAARSAKWMQTGSAAR